MFEFTESTKFIATFAGSSGTAFKKLLPDRLECECDETCLPSRLLCEFAECDSSLTIRLLDICITVDLASSPRTLYLVSTLCKSESA